MRRLLKIALREYLAYVRTVGFWLSMCLMPLVFILLLHPLNPRNPMHSSPILYVNHC